MEAEEEDQINESLQSMELELSTLEQYLSPFFETNLAEKYESLTPLEQTKLNIALAYSINALYYIFLRLSGISPAEHKVKGELDRVKLYIQKLNTVKLKIKEKATMRLNVEAANRFIAHVLSNEQFLQEQ
jgi:exosome complex protein LRP1